jgi:5-methylcytosine-specific restriction enzyme subunit McrC
MIDGQVHIYPEITRKSYFKVFLKGDRFVFHAGGIVGLIPINDNVSIDISPRVPVGNLGRILRIAEEAPDSLDRYFRLYDLRDEVLPSLIDLFASSLCSVVDAIAHNGLFHEYRRQEADTSFPRGRILVGEAARRHEARGVTHKVRASWFESSIDVGVNRCIKSALWSLAQRYRAMRSQQRPRTIVSRLNRTYQLFNGVSLDRAAGFIDDPMVLNPQKLPETRSYYVPALYLARAIVKDRGMRFDKSGGNVQMASLLLSLEVVFEKYLRNVLRKIVARLSKGRLVVLDGNKKQPTGASKPLFDPGPPEHRASETRATPDIAVFDTEENRYSVVLDAKYKPIDGIPGREDINQVIGYGFSYRAKSVVIVHPRLEDNDHGAHALGVINGVRFFQYAFDLAAKDLEAEEETFAQVIYELALQS